MTKLGLAKQHVQNALRTECYPVFNKELNRFISFDELLNDVANIYADTFEEYNSISDYLTETFG